MLHFCDVQLIARSIFFLLLRLPLMDNFFAFVLGGIRPRYLESKSDSDLTGFANEKALTTTIYKSST